MRRLSRSGHYLWVNPLTGDTPMTCDPLMTPDEVCERLRCSRSTLDRAVADSVLVPIRFGKLIRFHPDDIDDFIQRFRANGDE